MLFRALGFALLLTLCTTWAAPLPAPKPETFGLGKIQGKWAVQSLSAGTTRGKGKARFRSTTPQVLSPYVHVHIDGKMWTFLPSDPEQPPQRFVVRVDPNQRPMHLDLTPLPPLDDAEDRRPPGPMTGVFERRGNLLLFCFREGRTRPRSTLPMANTEMRYTLRLVSED
jgi:uncharacterized protein (TIGR03067 family)